MSSVEVVMIGAEKKALVTGAARAEGIFRVEWNPGNGSRYQLLFVELLPKLQVPGMPDEGGWMVVEGPTPRATHAGYFNRSGALVYNYVQEKMGFRSRVDASEVTRVIGTMLGRPFRVCTDLEGDELPDEAFEDLGFENPGWRC